MNSHFCISTSVVLAVAAQLVFKKGAGGIIHSNEPQRGLVQTILKTCFRVDIMAGFLLYGLSSFFYLLAMSSLELSYVFPFVSASYVLVPLMASVLFGEVLSAFRKIGIFLICVGLLLLTLS